MAATLEQLFRINDVRTLPQTRWRRGNGLLCHSERSEESRSLLPHAETHIPHFVRDNKRSKVAHYLAKEFVRNHLRRSRLGVGSARRISAARRILRARPVRATRFSKARGTHFPRISSRTVPRQT